MTNLQNKRLHNFDMLKGYFILLALYQHFCFFTNLWFTNYFNEYELINTVYRFFLPIYDQVIPVTEANTFLHRWFTPWVSQVYLMLAAFNLSSRKQQEFTKEYLPKLKIFGTLFLFFLCENFLMSKSFGDSFALYPLLTWMIVLSIIATLYRFFGIKAILVLFVLQCFKWVIPVDAWTVLAENYLREHFHPSFYFDARIDYFIGSGCLGFLYGYAYYHLKWNNLKLYYIPFAIGCALALNWRLYGPPFYIEVENILSTEHLASESISGTLGVWGIQLYVLSFFLYLENIRSISLKIPVLNWVGVHSLAVFGIHRVFFVFILMPTIVYLFAKFEIPLVNSLPFIWTCIAITVGFGWLIRKIKMHEILFK